MSRGGATGDDEDAGFQCTAGEGPEDSGYHLDHGGYPDAAADVGYRDATYPDAAVDADTMLDGAQDAIGDRLTTADSGTEPAHTSSSD